MWNVPLAGSVFVEYSPETRGYYSWWEDGEKTIQAGSLRMIFTPRKVMEHYERLATEQRLAHSPPEDGARSGSRSGDACSDIVLPSFDLFKTGEDD